MSDPYAKDAQIFTFGVHGTINTPENVREVTQRISAAVGRTTEGANLWDNGFDWRARMTCPQPPYPGQSTRQRSNSTDRRHPATEMSRARHRRLS